MIAAAKRKQVPLILTATVVIVKNTVKVEKHIWQIRGWVSKKCCARDPTDSPGERGRAGSHGEDATK